MKVNKIFITIFVFLVMLSSAEAYLFRTAAIDGPSYCEDGLYVYINPSTITVGGATKTGTPAANFNVNANTVYDVTYSASGYQTDTDDFYFDAGLPTCSGTTCHLTTSHFDTHCTYSPTYDDWTCVVTDAQTEQWISFIYTKNDPTYGEVIRILNSMYPGECMPGEEECNQCGYSNVGECEYGTRTRVCNSDYAWGGWSSCVGAVYPTTEICDGKDNDCDGLIDEDGVCWECTTDEECNHLDEDYCFGDIIKHKEGVCVNHECIADETTVQDCGELNETYCEGSWIKNKGYTCEASECVVESTNDIMDCDNGLFCDGQETCENAECVQGTAPDCGDENECTDDICNEDLNKCENPNFPQGTECGQARDCPEDSCLDVYMYYYPVDGHDTCDGQGTCVEYSCESTDNECDQNCGAECDSENPCPQTDCDNLDGCYGNDYYDYNDVANTCLGDCACTENECGQPEISYNDPRCTECTTDEDCNYLDRDYCDCTTYVMHDEGRCIDYECIAEPTQVENCNDYDQYYCDDTKIMHDDYWCFNAQCEIKDSYEFSDCDDGLYCNGQETCSNAQCVSGTEVDCSQNNIEEIATCNFCDSNPLTWDYREAFTSECVNAGDNTGYCTEGNETVTHECSVNNCNAECDSENPCPQTDCDNLDGCYGNDYYDYNDVANTCLGDCACTENECGQPEISYNDPRCFSCNPGETEQRSCYTGPEGTLGVGICSSGIQTKICSENGQWSGWGECSGEITPQKEICDGKDNDCDGEIDEEGVCFSCTPGETEQRSCYEGPEGTEGVGICEPGFHARVCDSEGTWLDWGLCMGAVYPAEEICDGKDNDCDEIIDEGCEYHETDKNSRVSMTTFTIINEDYIKPGDEVTILSTFENLGEIDFEDLRITFAIPALGVMRRVGPFDLEDGDEETNIIRLGIPSWATPGYYDIRASLVGDDIRRVKHREIYVNN